MPNQVRRSTSKRSGNDSDSRSLTNLSRLVAFLSNTCGDVEPSFSLSAIHCAPKMKNPPNEAGEWVLFKELSDVAGVGSVVVAVENFFVLRGSDLTCAVIRRDYFLNDTVSGSLLTVTKQQTR